MGFRENYEKDYRDKVKKQGKQTYLSWSSAWAEVMKIDENASFTVFENPNGLPYWHDKDTGYIVKTSVTVDGITRQMHLFVMDGANKAMKNEIYTYEVNEYEYVNGKPRKTGNMIEKNVEQATMFDINKTIMRCLVKNIALLGIGLYLYEGEDMPKIIEQDYNYLLNQLKTNKAINEGEYKFYSSDLNNPKKNDSIVKMKIDLIEILYECVVMNKLEKQTFDSYKEKLYDCDYKTLTKLTRKYTEIRDKYPELGQEEK